MATFDRPERPQLVLPWQFPSPIETERLRLRVMSVDDVDDVYAWMSDPEVARYQLYDPRTREQVQASVEASMAATTLTSTGDFVQPAIELRGGPVIGALYLSLKNAEELTAEIGWALTARYHGHGYAYEAAAALIELVFSELGLHRLVAELDPRNLASVALCERLGLRKEAEFRQDLWFKGGWADTGVYGLLAEEWSARS